MTGTKHPFEKSVKTFNESLQERLDQSLTRISQKSIGNICVALLESRVSDSSNIISRTPIGPNAPYLTMRVQFRNDINLDRVPLFLLATVQPLPPFDTYMEIEKNVELDSSFEFAARGSPTSGKYENSENSRTVAFCGDPYGFVLDSTIQKLYELLLIRMKAFDIDDWAPYFVFTSQTKSSVVKKLTAKILENHPLNTLQLNRYMSFDANIEEGADTFCALFCIRCYQYDCVHHIDKAVKRRLSHFGRNWAIGTKSEPSNDGILNDIMRGNASEHDLALKLRSVSASDFRRFLENRRLSTCDSEFVPPTLAYGSNNRYTTSSFRLKVTDAYSRYVPCSHEGSCSSSNLRCRCVLAGSRCGKFCICAKEGCERQFRGCKCGETGCTKRQSCSCYLSLRECDPELCHSMAEGSVCVNSAIQRGNRLRLRIGLSEVAGLGVFLDEPAKKDQFIYEYCGEIVSQSEADRRGGHYDQNRCSFLFNLNNEQVVDATHYGNKIRFANHSKKPNCYARLMIVNGDHRIGIYALKSLDVGEELFFDYQYSSAKKLAAIGCERISTTDDSSDDDK